MLISEKSRMVTYLFLSCYVNEIQLSSSYKKYQRILGTDYFFTITTENLIDCMIKRYHVSLPFALSFYQVHMYPQFEVPLMNDLGYAVGPGTHSLFSLTYSTVSNFY